MGSKSSSGHTTIISSETVVIGDLHFNGSPDIEGLVQGNIIALPPKDAIVRDIERGRVEGEIRVPRVVVNGEVVGDVYSSSHMELAPKARVSGNVYYTLVEMAVGAEVNGSLKHVDEPDKVQGEQMGKTAVGSKPALNPGVEKRPIKEKR